jgi:putative sterol carrier protein
MAVFPTADWVQAVMVKLNNDEHYAQVARNWEGDFRFLVEPGGALKESVRIYLDLWHGKCRNAFIEEPTSTMTPAFILKAPYGNFVKVLSGEIDPMQALLTRKLGVQGSMTVLMRNVPTVLDFVRCCREITDSWL